MNLVEHVFNVLVSRDFEHVENVLHEQFADTLRQAYDGHTSQQEFERESVKRSTRSDSAGPLSSASLVCCDDRVVSDGFKFHGRQHERQIVAVPVRAFRNEK